MTAQRTRIEHDLLGDRTVAADAYYGVHTLRAVENFPISGLPISIYADLVRALACVKQAAALTNHELGMLDRAKADAIVSACEDMRAGRLHDQFVVDVIQGGAGTSTNMNANEVIANLGLEKLGHARGEYRYLHPNEDVNMGQSTNDVGADDARRDGFVRSRSRPVAAERIRADHCAQPVQEHDAPAQRLPDARDPVCERDYGEPRPAARDRRKTRSAS